MNRTRRCNLLRPCVAFVLLGAASASHAGANPASSLFDASFDAEPLDQPIAAGGPELGEPVAVDSGLSAIVRAAPRPSPSLELSQTLQGLSRSVRFEFLGGEEVLHGDLIMRLTLRPEQFDFYNVYVREPGSSKETFLNIYLEPSGDIAINDASGSLGIVGTYTIATDHQFVFKFHMDLGTYDVEMDSVALLTTRAHGVTARGIGALLVGVGDTAQLSSRLYLDRIHVTRGDGIFRDDFE